MLGTLLMVILLSLLSMANGEVCPEGFTQDSDSGQCYFISTSLSNFDTAKASCSNIGGFLIEPKTSIQQETIEKILESQNVENDIWFGMRDSGTGFKWLSDNTSISWTNWYAREPNGQDTSCVRLKYSEDWHWANRGCSRSYRYMCFPLITEETMKCSMRDNTQQRSLTFSGCLIFDHRNAAYHHYEQTTSTMFQFCNVSVYDDGALTEFSTAVIQSQYFYGGVFTIGGICDTSSNQYLYFNCTSWPRNSLLQYLESASMSYTNPLQACNATAETVSSTCYFANMNLSLHLACTTTTAGSLIELSNYVIDKDIANVYLVKATSPQSDSWSVYERVNEPSFSNYSQKINGSSCLNLNNGAVTTTMFSTSVNAGGTIENPSDSRLVDLCSVNIVPGGGQNSNQGTPLTEGNFSVVLVSDPVGWTPVLRIVCLQNCGSVLNPEQKLAMSVNCNTCNSTNDYIYEWSFHPVTANSTRNSINWTIESTTGNMQSNLVIRNRVLSAHKAEQYMFIVNATRINCQQNCMSVFANLTVTTNPPPLHGRCGITPTTGFVLDTKFVVNCTGFLDNHLPLTYNVLLEVDNPDTSSSVTKALLYSGNQTSTPEFYLSDGQESKNFMRTIYVQIEDNHGAMTEINTSVTVREQTIELSSINNMVSGNSSELGRLLQQGDVQAATGLIGTVVSVLNRASTDQTADPNAQREERKQLRKSLISSLSTIEVNSVSNLAQVVTTISDVTSVKEELSPQSQNAAAGIVQNLAGVLKGASTDGTISDDLLQQCSESIMKSVSSIIGSARLSSESSENIINSAETKQQYRNTAMASLTAVDDVKRGILVRKVAGEEASVIRSGSMVLQLSKVDPLNLQEGSSFALSSSSDTESGIQNEISLPSSFDVSAYMSGNGGSINTEIVQYMENPYIWSNQSSVVTSAVSDFVLRSGDTEISVTNLTDPIDMFLPQTTSVPQKMSVRFEEDKENIAFFNTEHNDNAVLIFMGPLMDSFGKPTSAADIGIILEILQLFTSLENTTFDAALLRNQTKRIVKTLNITSDMLGTALISNSEPILLLKPDDLQEPGYFALTLSNSSDLGPFLNLDLLLMQGSCVTWDASSEEWTTHYCKMGNRSTLAYLHCSCTHMTSYAGGLIIMPNKLDFSKITMFLSFWQNPIAIGAVAAIFILYVLLLVWARRKDKEDEIKAEPVDLADNHPLAMYPYAVVVYTGSRPGASTTATVTLMLVGDEGRSSPHLMKAENYRVFKRGAINVFILRTHQPLGTIQAVRVWHDNTGTNPDWFLSRIVVGDVIQNRNFNFMCDSWLSDTIGDGYRDKTFLAVPEEATKQFGYIMRTRATREITDGNIWISIMARPVQSPFTRIQRLTCCLSLLTSFMLGNMMFYGVEGDPNLKRVMENAPFQLDLKGLIIAVETAIIFLPMNTLFMKIFNSAKWIKADDNSKEVLHAYEESRRYRKSSCTSLTSEEDETEIRDIDIAEPQEESHLPSTTSHVKSRTFKGAARLVSITQKMFKKRSLAEEATKTARNIRRRSAIRDVSGTIIHDTWKEVYWKRGVGLKIKSIKQSKRDSGINSKKWPTLTTKRNVKTVNGDSSENPTQEKDILRLQSIVEANRQQSLKDNLYCKPPSNTCRIQKASTSSSKYSHRSKADSMKKSSHGIVSNTPSNMINKTAGSVNESKYTPPEASLNLGVQSNDINFSNNAIPTADKDAKAGSSSQSPTSIRSISLLSQEESSKEDFSNYASNYDTSFFSIEPSKDELSCLIEASMNQLSCPIAPSMDQLPCSIEPSTHQLPYDKHESSVEQQTLSNNSFNEIQDLNSLPEGAVRRSMLYLRKPLKRARSVYPLAERGVSDMKCTIETSDKEKSQWDSNMLYYKSLLFRVLYYVNWISIWLTILTTVFFTILYSFDYGSYASMQWLKSFFLCTFMDLILQEPAQGLLVVAIVSLIWKSQDSEMELTTVKKWKPVASTSSEADMEVADFEWKQRHTDKAYIPPEKGGKYISHVEKQEQSRLYSILMEFGGYFLFMFLILLITYGRRDTNIFRTNNAFSEVFFPKRPHLFKEVFSDEIPYLQTINVRGLYNWINTTVKDNVYPEGGQPGHLDNALGILLEPPTLRQIRVVQGNCGYETALRKFPKPDLICTHSYDSKTHDARSYRPNWASYNNETGDGQADHWMYNPSVGYSIRGREIQYSTGGYVASLGVNRSSFEAAVMSLYEELWLDRQTAAVILEMETYNPNTNMLTVTQGLFEFPSHGGVLNKSLIRSMTLYRSTDSLQIFVIVFEVVFCGYVLGFFICLLVHLQEKGVKSYFSTLLAWVDLMLLVVALVGIGIYAGHAIEVNRVLQNFKKAPINFSLAMSLDDSLVVCMGILVAVGTVKGLHIIRFSENIHTFSLIVLRALPECMIILFASMVWKVGFSCLVNLLIGTIVEPFRTVWKTYGVLAWDTDDECLFYVQIDPIFGPLLFCGYIIVRTCILSNLLMTVICHMLKEVSKEPQPNEDADFVKHVLERIRHWFMLKRNH